MWCHFASGEWRYKFYIRYLNDRKHPIFDKNAVSILLLVAKIFLIILFSRLFSNNYKIKLIVPSINIDNIYKIPVFEILSNWDKSFFIIFSFHSVKYSLKMYLMVNSLKSISGLIDFTTSCVFITLHYITLHFYSVTDNALSYEAVHTITHQATA